MASKAKKKSPRAVTNVGNVETLFSSKGSVCRTAGTTMYQEHHSKCLNLRHMFFNCKGEQNTPFSLRLLWVLLLCPYLHPFCVRLGLLFFRGLQEKGEMPRVQSGGKLRHRQVHGHMVSDHVPFTNVLAREIVPRDCCTSSLF